MPQDSDENAPIRRGESQTGQPWKVKQELCRVLVNRCVETDHPVETRVVELDCADRLSGLLELQPVVVRVLDLLQACFRVVGEVVALFKDDERALHSGQFDDAVKQRVDTSRVVEADSARVSNADKALPSVGVQDQTEPKVKTDEGVHNRCNH